jgi:hypothetical protein
MSLANLVLYSVGMSVRHYQLGHKNGSSKHIGGDERLILFSTKQDSHRSKQQQETDDKRLTTDVNYRDIVLFNVNRSHRNDSDVTFKIIAFQIIAH